MKLSMGQIDKLAGRKGVDGEVVRAFFGRFESAPKARRRLWRQAVEERWSRQNVEAVGEGIRLMARPSASGF